VVLALFSWGDATLWLPAARLPVQLIALLAASWGWRKLPLEALADASEACRDVARTRERLEGYAFEYQAEPRDSAGRRTRFSLFARPKHPPDSGLVTLVADEWRRMACVLGDSEACGR